VEAKRPPVRRDAAAIEEIIMRIALWAAALAILGAAPAFGQTTATVHANTAARVNVPAVVPNTAAVQQNMYQQNQQAQQGALQDTTQSQQRVQALSQRNQEMLQTQQSTSAGVTR
jgi:hypothetical protein